MIQRYKKISDMAKPGKVLMILGPRRTGKTTLLEQYAKQSKNYLFYRGDDLSTQENFSIPRTKHLKEIIGDAKILIIDEAQVIPDIGKTLKLLTDTQKDLTIVVTGSSAYELHGQIGEPLTGRKDTRYLLPISVAELYSKELNPKSVFMGETESMLVYGLYPNVVTARSKSAKEAFLLELVDAYLLKDILQYQEVKGSRVLLQLLSLLAFQIGSEVSHTELGNKLGIDKNTVARYLDLLEKTYVIFRLGGYSNNLRSEVTKKAKYYFYDVGVRNALINNFNPLSKRNDVGKLWENFIIVERLKKRLYYGPKAQHYFWRTWKGSEIDLIEQRSGKLYAYEIKWSMHKKPSIPTEWKDAYPKDAPWKIINTENAWEFIS